MSDTAVSAPTPFQHAADRDPRFAAVRDRLSDYAARRAPDEPHVRDELARIKAQAVAAGDQVAAGAAWCLEQIAEAQDTYLRAWATISDLRFYAAWCALEQCELALHFLARHYDDADDTYGVAFLREYVPRWQSLFPYRMFFSPGFTKRSVRCSVCGAHRTPRTSCGHRLGHLYDGAMCHFIVDDVRMLEVSLVTRPVQKYSVAFLKGEPYNYAAVHYVACGLLSPWHRWEGEWTTRRREDPTYAGLGPRAQCPCGSGRPFKRCHRAKRFYDAPHLEVAFLDGVAAALPRERIGQAVHGLDDQG